MFLGTVQTGLLTLIAASLNMAFYMLSVRRFYIYKFIHQSHFKCLLTIIIRLYRPTARMSFRNTMTKLKYANFSTGRHLVFNFITSKLYTISLLSSLNSRQGWGYDTCENNDVEFDLSAGLRFASISQSTDDRTSVITTPPVSPLLSPS
jgi:hypothetical protein